MKSGSGADRCYRFGAFRIDTLRRVLEQEGRLVPMPRKSAEILLLLLAEPGRLVTKEELFRSVWPEVVVEENSLAQAISALRKALGDEARGGDRAPRFVETVARHGYRFCGRTESEPAVSPSPLAALEAEPALPHPEPVLAVLPFRLLGSGGVDDELGLGLADALISRLACLSGLRLRSTAAVRRWAGGADVDPLAAGRELMADYVLDGHLRQLGNRLAVSAQLLRTDGGDLLWAERLGESLDDLLEMEDRLAERIAQALALGWRRDRPAWRRGTVDVAAYQLYWRGRQAANRMSADGHAQARAAFEAAIARDPLFALAYEGLAYADVMAVDLFVPSAVGFPRARKAAEQALVLDPGLALAHCALAGVAFWHDRDLRAAEAEIRAALALDPEGASTRRGAGWLLALAGRFEEAYGLFATGAAADPFDIEQVIFEAACLYSGRRFDEAMVLCRRGISFDPSNWLPQVLMGRCWEARGDLDEALSHFEVAARLDPTVPEIQADLGRALGLAGRAKEARVVLAGLGEPARFAFVPAFARAMVHLGLGEKDRCFAELEASLAERSWYVSWLRTVPALDPIRPDPRFADLQRRSGL
ncbi:MAG TPA: winged helix-turn-helix domain-containing protein [Thermoanaerobaculia bacterium]|nr:winged helix-turn-helix domain-containing protein [Thermoanaerobaculia bacterium]